MKIEDFGEKIGGAKKDTWRRRGLLLDDLLEMNEQEKLKFIKKDNVWKKPNYQKMVDEGLPVRVAYYIKSVRDSLPTKPYVNYITSSAEQERYVSFISEMRDAMMKLKSEDEVINFYPDFILENYIEQEGYRVYTKGNAVHLLDNKVLQKVKVRNWLYIDREIERKQFCYSQEEKILADYQIIKYDKNKMSFDKDYRDNTMLVVKVSTGKRFYYPKGEFSNEENWIDQTYFIMTSREIIRNNFASYELAKAFVLEREQGKEKLSNTTKRRKKAFLPPQLEHIKRTGENYRRGRNVAGNDYLDTFEFRGGEFGNWLNENDRQQSLNYGYDALLDMCKALKIHPKDISLGNTLSIAFGARGEGNALAHYEPLRTVINLTKMKGAGSLAHEWGHALDDYIGRSLGYKGIETMASGHAKQIDNLPSVKKIMEQIHYKLDDSPKQILEQMKKYEDKKKSLDRLLDGYLKFVSDKYSERKEVLKQAFISSKNPIEREDILEKISKLKKDTTNHGLLKSDKENLIYSLRNLDMLEEKIGKPERVKTDFYNNSVKFDEISSKTGHGYWQSNEEMFARAFACYIYDKVGGRSDYLCGHANSIYATYQHDNGTMETIKAFPVGEEREKINQCFDELMIELKEKGYVQSYEFSEKTAEKVEQAKEDNNEVERIIPVLNADENGQFSFDLDDELEYER